MPDRLQLLPQPRKIKQLPGTLPAGAIAKQINNDQSISHPQGYRLSISPTGITISASTPAGQFYGAATLRQLQRQFPKSLPCLEIEDHPDFPVRGVMLDISRDKVPTMQTLYELIDLLASWKINQLQLYIEHTFAYSQHKTVWASASPMTAQEIRDLDTYCQHRFIELVPNQNSFGHMERWLKHPQYQHLAEAIDGSETPWGFRWKGPFSLCPTDPASIELLAGLYAELLPNFSSRLFNIGCDETFDVGQGRSKTESDRRGKMHVYLDFLKKVDALVQSNNRKMMFWGDIIIHKPELIPELPKGAIALEWGYDSDHPFDRDGSLFAAAGIPFYVCPGTSSWNTFAGRTDNAIANLRSAAENGLKHKAIGYLNTDWGDNGHFQYLPVSYLGFAAGAAFSWCLDTNKNIDIVAALNDEGFPGQTAFDLGNVYQVCNRPTPNGSALFRVLILPPNDPHPEKGLTEQGLSASEEAIRTAVSQIKTSQPLVADEFRSAAALLQFGIETARRCLNLPGRAGPKLSDILTQHRRLWLARNRPGGLEDSIARLSPLA
jgi:hexosaminidase